MPGLSRFRRSELLRAMKFILAKKIEMSQIFRPDGTVVPVTLLQAGPCVVTQVKDDERDGYKAVQLGFTETKKLAKPQENHLKGLPKLQILREFRLTETDDVKRGDTIDATKFVAGDRVHVTGTSKGKGFQGTVKRHGFHGSPASHGHKDQLRMPGSIGAGGVQRVFKGKKMAGQTGNVRVTVKNLEIVDVKDGIIALKGAVPGARNTILEIRSV